MLEDLLYQISSLMPNIDTTPVSSHSLPLNYVCAAFGALILSRFTGSIGALALTTNFFALFGGASSVDQLTKHVKLPMDHNLAQPMLTAIVGMIIAAMLVLVFKRRNSAYE